MKPEQELPRAVQEILNDTALEEPEAWFIYHLERGDVTSDVSVLTEKQVEAYKKRHAATYREIERKDREYEESLPAWKRRALELARGRSEWKPDDAMELTSEQEELMQQLQFAHPHVTAERAKLVILLPDLYGLPAAPAGQGSKGVVREPESG